MSYTTFEYSNLAFSEDSIGPYGETTVTCKIRNSGDRAGAEVVQLYIRDLQSSVVRPVKELKGFEKIVLQPGESKEVYFAMGHSELSMLDAELDRVVEPGAFEVMVGSSSEDIRLEGNLTVVSSRAGR